MAVFNSFPIQGRKITENPASDALTGAEILVLVQGDITKKITLQALFDYFGEVQTSLASAQVLGVVKLSKAPANVLNPIAVGTNDERVGATGVQAGTYGSGKLLTVEVDQYGKVKSISEETFRVLAENVEGLSLTVQQVGDGKYVLKNSSSTLSVWRDDRVYKKDEFVEKDGKLYKSLEDGNNTDPSISDNWLKVGGGGDAVEVTKSGADVDANGDLDLSDIDIPANPKPTVYVDNVTGNWQTQFNKQTKILTGLYGIDPGATIEIIF
ncbi:hypothetical protein BCY91_14155 [Pelobium manganitolerans]|uniref:Uncharacterized protein n=1 Tax=Pelobium manganitolerans TaxID=1842495 RepID=A0A419SA00_9SPHI|nr:hypothetical protein [Pelobium manganitolerans]RKD19016.1 hypothetical protein BCY91_14155 [Pelobium manganitolerans]